MVGQSRGPIRYMGGERDRQVQQRGIRVLVRDAVVPERKPRQISKILRDISREADERSLNRAHLVEVFSLEQLPADVEVDGKKRGETGRCPGTICKAPEHSCLTIAAIDFWRPQGDSNPC